ncbi:MAG: molybdopterin-binding protein [bacterium]|nr:molybdopterin-binding protein [bacterium]
MKFEAVPVEQAAGLILGHNVAGEGGSRALRKGKRLTAEDLAVLEGLGRRSVYVATLEPGDVEEDDAAERIAAAAAGDGLRRSRASTGRVNLYAQALGLLRIDRERLRRLNDCDGVTLATLPGHSAVRRGKMVATLKIIPYALSEGQVARAEEAAAGLLRLTALGPRRVGLILSGSPSARERIVRGFREALAARLEALAATLGEPDFVSLEDEGGEERLAAAITAQLAAGIDLLILAGETAIMDAHDIAPRAIERAGGEVECYGAPVDPGNLLLLAYRDGVPIVGAPGCARSPKQNIVDLVLPRLLAGDRLTRADVAAFGHGGLLEDVPERPLPRSWIS